MSGKPKKICLWTAPRSLSTAFLRAMMSRSNTKVFVEPYAMAFFYGAERQSTSFGIEPIRKCCTYQDILHDIEQPYTEFDVVFVKEMARYLINRLDSAELLSKQYTHTFILRNPHKAIPSLYKMSLNTDATGCDHFETLLVGHKELYQVYKLVTEDMGQPAIVIDADDLLRNPEAILRLYCDKVGIDFQDSMINWKEPNNIEIFQQWLPWFGDALKSKTFMPAATATDSLQCADLPTDVQALIEDSMVYYNEMYAVRLTKNGHQHGI